FFFDANMNNIEDMAFGPTLLYATYANGGGVIRFNKSNGAAAGYTVPAGTGESYWGILVAGGIIYVSNTSTGTIRQYNDLSNNLIDERIVGFGASDIVPWQIPEPSGFVLLMAFPLIFGANSRRCRSRTDRCASNMLINHPQL